MNKNPYVNKNFVKTVLTALACIIVTLLCTDFTYASSAKLDNINHIQPEKYSNCIIFDGIDVSYWNGGNIDWAKVKRAGVDYAFIRIGYTSYGPENLVTNSDSWFETNYANAKANGVMVGVYYYSAAITSTEAKSEAKYVLKLLNGRDLDLPVVCDAEFPSNSRVSKHYNKWSSSTKRSTLTNISLAFLDYIEANSDYSSMFYSYRGIVDSNYNPSGYKYNISKIDSKYPFWIAQYSEAISYPREFEYWQYTSTGKVSGISGSTDCNFWYFDKDRQMIPEAGKSAISDCKVTLGTKNYTYSGAPKKPKVTVKTADGTVLTKDTDYKVSYMKNVKIGTAYAMITGIGDYSGRKLVSFKINTEKLDSKYVTSSISYSSCRYTGKERKPAVVVKYKDEQLKKGTNYTVTYENNIYPGTAGVTIKGLGNYEGIINKYLEFTINKAKLTFEDVYDIDIPCDAKPFNTDITVNSDGILSYASDNEEIATVSDDGTITLTGTVGSCKITVSCAEADYYVSGSTSFVLNVNESLHGDNHTYGDWKTVKQPTCTEDGLKRRVCSICKHKEEEKLPALGHTEVTDPAVDATCETAGLTEGKHCSVCGEVIEAQIEIMPLGHDYQEIKPGTKTSCDEDGYTPLEECSRCKKRIGGELQKATGHVFDFVPSKRASTKSSGKLVEKCLVCGFVKSTEKIPQIKKVTLSRTSFVYNKKSRHPYVTVTDVNGNVIKKSNYDADYSKGRKAVGKYTVKIKFKEKYRGTVTKSFKIVPKGTEIKKFKKITRGFTVYYKKQSVQTSAYQIKYSTKKDMSSAKYVSVKNLKTTSKTIKNLKRNKKYYVQVRTYKVVNGTKFYSKWSKQRTVTTKA